MAFIELKDVSFAYEDENGGKKTILKKIDLKIEKGSFVTVLGRNGSGKSTLAKIMNALLIPENGEVNVNGILPDSPENIWNIRKSVGMVFQNPDNQIVESIVEWDIAFGCENLGVDPIEIRKRIDESLKDVNMSGSEKKMTAYLSGGEKQRIAIAGVLAMKGECIIFDEATSMLDPVGRNDIMNIMKKLNERGVTIINITHFMDEALLSERIIIIDKGSIVSDGSADTIFSDINYLRSIKLDVPLIREITYYLREKGYDISENISSKEELFAQLSKYPYENFPEKIKEEIFQKNETIMQLKDISCVYAKGTPFEKKALKNVNLDIKKGEFIAVIGHTGSGKSTLMQILGALADISEGNVYYKGKNILSDKDFLHDVRSKVGIVFQYPEYQLFEVSVYEDVAFAPKNMKLNAQSVDKRVKEALECVGLGEEYYDRSPFALSGGEKRRAAIAGILAMDPEIIALDEPAAGLDPAGKKEIFEYISKIHITQKKTVIIVSHSMEDAAKYAQKIIVMNDGKAVYCGSKEQIFEKNIEKIGLSLPDTVKISRYFTEMGCPLSCHIYDNKEISEEIAAHFRLH